MSDTQQSTAISTHLEPSQNAAALIMDQNSYQAMHQIAKLMAEGKTSVPQHLRGNTADCMAIVLQAMQWQMNPFAVAQKSFIVNGGQIGYEAQLVNAVIATRAPITGRLNYEWFGDWSKIIGNFREIESKDKKDDYGRPKKFRVPNWSIQDEQGLGVKVWATFIGEDAPRVLETLMMQARTRNSTLWADDPKQQIAYLATKKWARLHCPDVIMGVYTPDEFEDSYTRREIDITPSATGSDSQSSGSASAVAGETFGPRKNDEATNEVFRKLLAVARKHDIGEYEREFKALKPAQRAAIGTECHERLKSIATTVDADYTEVHADAAEQQQAEGAEQ
ncbi:RecT family recombinase [Stutzerimonas nitrititolerans]|uniref:RecT family recombinase n=1 Tax=Stutzerimonas nitrititolerans TaxID=2482751 RepID=UPI0028AC8ACB|nr:RecT family recombinase [Stutzerimonas nitrititolerans]